MRSLLVKEPTYAPDTGWNQNHLRFSTLPTIHRNPSEPIFAWICFTDSCCSRVAQDVESQSKPFHLADQDHYLRPTDDYIPPLPTQVIVPKVPNIRRLLESADSDTLSYHR